MSIDILGNNADESPTTSGAPHTSTQAFLRHPAGAVVLGIVLPAICVAFDPIVFRSGDFGAAMFGAYCVAGYGLIALSATALAVWLILKPLPSLFSGFLASGCVVALAIGIAILPMSLIGLMLVIGALGFVPFLTSLVYWQAAKKAREVAGGNYRPAWAVIGFIALLATPLGTQFYLSSVATAAMAQLSDGTEAEAEEAIRQLTRLGPLVDSDQLAWRYLASDSKEEQQRLTRAFTELTGGDLEERAWRLAD